ncbi:hypothetical protein [Frisingicoccus sp.]|uniref:hypothetical protein n=1 Tax=Frisingicoccus sp. TaxID=1918627 RepID=UPI0039999C9D
MLKEELSKSVLFADREVLFVMIQKDNKEIIGQLYDNIYITPGLYDTLIRVLDIDDLKIMKSLISKTKDDISQSSIDTIIKDFPNLTTDEAYAIAYCMKNNMDVIFDDPQKAEICKQYHINAIRPSDILRFLSKFGGA